MNSEVNDLPGSAYLFLCLDFTWNIIIIILFEESHFIDSL